MLARSSQGASPADTAAAKKRFVAELANTGSVPAALKAARRSARSTYDTWRREDPEFRGVCDAIMAGRKAGRGSAEGIGFAEFRERFLNSRTFAHQQGWVDLLEGNDPVVIPGSVFERQQPNRLLVNTPPNHAKSMTVTIDYAVYRICRDPNVRIIVVSKTQAQAKKFLFAIKQRLTHPAYALLQGTFGPPGGFRGESESWTATQIYLGGEDRDSGEKDPTVEALGMGGQIYGARADLIILDDCVTLSNAGEWEKQMDWIRIEVSSRLGPHGKLLVIGTRVAPVDLYRELRNPDHYSSGRPPWTYLAQPAVLDYGTGDPSGWRTLWPRSDRPFEGAEFEEPDEEGLFPRWDGPALARVRDDVGPRIWSMVYQQQDVDEVAIFDQLLVTGSVNGMRKAGRLVRGAPGHPDPTGFFVVCSLDPAMSQDTAAITYAVDRQSQKRYVLDAVVMPHPTPAAIRDLIEQWTDLYQPHEWVVEQNAFQLFLTEDEGIRRFLAGRGVRMIGHYTGRNKADPDFGVASLAPLFGTRTRKEGGYGGDKHAGDNLIELPDPQASSHVKALIEQLVTWRPGVRGSKLKQDLPMALWFAELRAREQLAAANRFNRSHLESEFTTARARSGRAVIRLDEWAQTHRLTG